MNKFEVRDLNLYYGQFHALKGVSMDIPEKEVTAFIGPSGCGKSHLPQDPQPHERPGGGLPHHRRRQAGRRGHLQGQADVNVLRKRVGMVFQKPNPFPMSIYDNIAYGPRTHGIRSKAQLDEIVERVAARRRHLGRVKGPAEKVRAGHVRRPAAASVHRPRPGRGAGSPADGRAHLRPGPHLHQPRGGAGHGPEEGLHHRHRPPTTCSRPPVSRTRPPSSCWARLVEMGPTERLFATPVRTSAPRITSPAASADSDTYFT